MAEAVTAALPLMSDNQLCVRNAGNNNPTGVEIPRYVIIRLEFNQAWSSGVRHTLDWGLSPRQCAGHVILLNQLTDTSLLYTTLQGASSAQPLPRETRMDVWTVRQDVLKEETDGRGKVSTRDHWIQSGTISINISNADIMRKLSCFSFFVFLLFEFLSSSPNNTFVNRMILPRLKV